jgi:hypothetical protein
MKFTSKIVKKAWELFKVKANGLSVKEAKGFLSDAYKQAIKYFKGLKKGIITFWKIETGEICQREVISLSDAAYQSKSDRKPNLNMFYFWDIAKQSVIGINNYQLL